MRIEEAIEVFGLGFGFTRSFTHPYAIERQGPLWVMRDAPRKRSDYRVEEWLVYGISPHDAEQLIQAHRRERYAVCAFYADGESGEGIKQGFKQLGYRYSHHETLFSHDLKGLGEFTSPLPIVQVTSADQAHALKLAAGSTQIRVSDIAAEPPLMRQYMAVDGSTPVGWVRSIVCGKSGWCSNMFVQPAYRRRGLGKALMSRMLKDDKTAGQSSAVLLASNAGALLYPHVGYKAIGHLMVFTKKR